MGGSALAWHRHGLGIAVLAVGGIAGGCSYEFTVQGSDVYLGGFERRLQASVEEAWASGAKAAARFEWELEPLRNRRSESTFFVDGAELRIEYTPHPDDASDTLVSVMCRCEWTVPDLILDELGAQAEVDGFGFAPGDPEHGGMDDSGFSSPTREILEQRLKASRQASRDDPTPVDKSGDSR